VTIEYQIYFEAGSVKITQRVDTGASSVNASPRIYGSTVRVLPNSKAAAAARAAGSGGSLSDPLGSGGSLSDPLGSGGDAGSAGQIIVFGPVVIDALGLLHRCSTESASNETEGGN